MTRPLSPSEFSPLTATRAPNDIRRDCDECFSNIIKDTLDARANDARTKADKAPSRGGAAGPTNGTNDAATPTALPRSGAGLAYLAARALQNRANTRSAADKTASGQEQPGGAIEPRGSAPSGQSGINLLRAPSWAQLAASQANNAAAQSKTAPSKTTSADQKPAGPSRMPRFTAFYQASTTFSIDSDPRNLFQPPIPGARPDGAAAIELTAGFFKDLTPKLRATVYGNVFAKRDLSEPRAAYSSAAIGARGTLKLSPKNQLTGGYEYLMGYNGTFKQSNFVGHNLTATFTRQLIKSAPGSTGWRQREANVSVGVESRFGNLRGQELHSGVSTIDGKFGPLNGQLRYEFRAYPELPVRRFDSIFTGRFGYTRSFGKDKNNSWTIGLSGRNQILPGPKTHFNWGPFFRLERRGEKHF